MSECITYEALGKFVGLLFMFILGCFLGWGGHWIWRGDEK